MKKKFVICFGLIMAFNWSIGQKVDSSITEFNPKIIIDNATEAKFKSRYTFEQLIKKEFVDSLQIFSSLSYFIVINKEGIPIDVNTHYTLNRDIKVDSLLNQMENYIKRNCRWYPAHKKGTQKKIKSYKSYWIIDRINAKAKN